MTVKLAVLTPTYNSKYLKQCIQSCKDNIKYPYRHILVDDGSTSVFKALLYMYNGVDNVEVHSLGENHGCGYVRNELLKHAAEVNPEYIIYLDSDDQLTDKVNNLIRLADETKCDIACGRLYSKSSKLGMCPRMDGLFTNRQHALEQNKFISMCILGKLFRFNSIKNLSFPNIRRSEDYVYMETLSRNSSLKSTDLAEVIYYKKFVADSAGRTGKPLEKEPLEKYCKENNAMDSRYLSEAK